MWKSEIKNETETLNDESLKVVHVEKVEKNDDVSSSTIAIYVIVAIGGLFVLILVIFKFRRWVTNTILT